MDSQPEINDEEIEKFISICERAWKTQQILVIQTASSALSRNLRKRFYRLRDSIPMSHKGRKYCDLVSFKLTGRLIKVTPDVDLSRATVASTSILSSPPVGVPTHGTDDQGEIPHSNRLNHQG